MEISVQFYGVPMKTANPFLMQFECARAGRNLNRPPGMYTLAAPPYDFQNSSARVCVSACV